ncbi:cupin domain-containing protein [uncultured Hoeflea sp.]|uniref:cupin domain-containing protein n=1 Tax=uncultured Hoeflea sp. TaxID=538666 RepID=UPI002603DE7C|nr:cupin domain-containing protein [uncultured Hoeflea sp.]
MPYPNFIQDQPSLDIPFPEDAVSTSAVRSDGALVVFLHVHKDVEIPEHQHGAQWGTVVRGGLELTVDGRTRQCVPGDSWDIPAGTPHAAKLKAGSLVIDVFEEPDRYPLKP